MPLTDAQWARIEPLLPDRTPKRGGRWRDHREVIDAIAFKFQTGIQWVHLPEKYANRRGIYHRLRMWAVSVDSIIVRAHQHASGARKRGRPRSPRRPPELTGSDATTARTGVVPPTRTLLNTVTATDS
ncbi:transposase [Streptomyces mirabilis]|uniref:transposase n=1 Tax=Streptomyces mirabilis TaxID=68239 RepID=UPI0036DED7CA